MLWVSFKMPETGGEFYERLVGLLEASPDTGLLESLTLKAGAH